jgi:hypothetical protein
MRRKFPTPCRRADQAATLRIVALGIPVPRQQRIQLIDLGASGHDALENISEIARRVDVVFALSMSDARMAHRSAPLSLLANRWFFSPIP